MAQLSKTLSARDWSEIVLAGVPAVMVLAFISAPRAMPELVGYVASVFDSPYGDDNRWVLIGGLIVGPFARGWRSATVLIFAAWLALFMVGLNLYGEASEQGMAMTGLLLFTGFSAAVARSLWLAWQRPKP